MEKRIIYGTDEILLDNLKFTDCENCLSKVNSGCDYNIICPVDNANRHVGCK